MFSSLVFSQSGVNIESPAATLDVTAKNPTGTTSNVDGFLVPRVDRQRAQSMTGVPTSTIIYINSIATGSQTDTAINIGTIGHYFYNGTVWEKLGAPAVANIYNSNGTLAGDRVVTQGDKKIAFTGTTANAFSVDENTFSIDAANNRVGIGTTTPKQQLDVEGQARIGMINPAVDNMVLTPVYADPNGVLVKATSSSGVYFSSRRSNVASGATAVLVSDIPVGGSYKATVSVGDACGDNSIAEYYIINVGSNAYHAINGLGGIVASSTTNKSPTFAQVSKHSIVTTWTGKATCAGGDNSTSFNYTLTLPSAGTINVTNNGNIAKTYTISVVRIN